MFEVHCSSHLRAHCWDLVSSAITVRPVAGDMPVMLVLAIVAAYSLQAINQFAAYVQSSIRLQYLVFEYIEKTLLEVLESRQRGLSPEEVGIGWHVMVQVADGRAKVCGSAWLSSAWGC